jgi:aryl-alcohol dehydrogenase-like predicted oxidoreductase
MLTRKLGQTGLELSVIGFGAWAIGGGGWKFGWGSQDDKESVAAIHEAVELGVNWIDTARVYGLGHSERIVATALADCDHQPLITTKCTRVWDDNGDITGSMNRESIRRELEASVTALRGRAIDMYLIHQPYPDDQIEEGWETLSELRDEGLVRYIGVSNFSLQQLERIQAISPVDLIQPKYSLLDQAVDEEVRPHCRANNIGAITYSPMGSGLLTGQMTAERIKALPNDDWRRTGTDFTEPALSRNLATASRLLSLGAGYGRSAGAMACAWVLGNPDVTSTIVGFRRPDQVRGILGADGFSLTNEQFGAVRKALS